MSVRIRLGPTARWSNGNSPAYSPFVVGIIFANGRQIVMLTLAKGPPGNRNLSVDLDGEVLAEP